MRKSSILLLIIFVTLCTAEATYVVTRHYVFKQAYRTGYDTAISDNRAAIANHGSLKEDYDKLVSNNASLFNENQQLVKDYNALLAAAKNYISAAKYTPKTSFSCSSYSYGTDYQVSRTSCY